MSWTAPMGGAPVPDGMTDAETFEAMGHFRTAGDEQARRGGPSGASAGDMRREGSKRAGVWPSPAPTRDRETRKG